jgi:hypothetical protein
MADGHRSNRPTPRTPAAAEAELRRRIRAEMEQARSEADGELGDGELAAIIARAVASALQWHLEAPEHTRNATLSSRSWRPAGGPRGARQPEERERDFDRPPRDFDRPPRDRDYDRPPRERGYGRPPRDFDRPPRDFDRPPREFDRPREDFDGPPRERDYERPPRDRDFDRPRRQGGKPYGGKPYGSKPYRGGGFKNRGPRRPPRSR